MVTSTGIECKFEVTVYPNLFHSAYVEIPPKLPPGKIQHSTDNLNITAL